MTETPVPAAKGKARVEGATTTFKAGDQSVKARWAVYDIADVTTSHDDILNINPAFPGELQPRDRGRQASREQVAELAQKFDPTLMGENPLAQHGAPIVGPDGVVESGNGRTIALRQLYGRHGGQKYRNWLRENAERFGIDADSVKGVKSPLLVRVRTAAMTPEERVAFTRTANARETAAMGAGEQAKVDADRITPGMYRLLDLGETGEITSATNRGFVRDFLANLPTSEQGILRTAEGGISQDGIRRIKNAIFHRAYGNLDALTRMAEAVDDPARNITNGMLRGAGPLMDLQRRIEEGSAYPVNIGPDVATAASKIAALREQGVSIGEYLAQESLFGSDLTDLQRNVLMQLDLLKRSPKQIAAILADYADLGIKAGDPSTGSLFDDISPPDKVTIWKAAVERTQRAESNEPSLFTETEGPSRTETEGRTTRAPIQAAPGTAAGATPAKAARQPAKVERVAKPDVAMPAAKRTKVSADAAAAQARRAVPERGKKGGETSAIPMRTETDSGPRRLMSDTPAEIEGAPHKGRRPGDCK